MNSSWHIVLQCIRQVTRHVVCSYIIHCLLRNIKNSFRSANSLNAKTEILYPKWICSLITLNRLKCLQSNWIRQTKLTDVRCNREVRSRKVWQMLYLNGILSDSVILLQAQGGEFPVVVIPLHHEFHSKLLNRQLVYTAVTRAQELLILISSRDVLRGCIAVSRL